MVATHSRDHPSSELIAATWRRRKRPKRSSSACDAVRSASAPVDLHDEVMPYRWQIRRSGVLTTGGQRKSSRHCRRGIRFSATHEAMEVGASQ